MSIGKIIDGKAFAAGLRERVADGVAAFVEQAGRKPGLAVVLVGEDALLREQQEGPRRGLLSVWVAASVHRAVETAGKMRCGRS